MVANGLLTGVRSDSLRRGSFTMWQSPVGLCDRQCRSFRGSVEELSLPLGEEGRSL